MKNLNGIINVKTIAWCIGFMSTLVVYGKACYDYGEYKASRELYDKGFTDALHTCMDIVKDSMKKDKKES